MTSAHLPSECAGRGSAWDELQTEAKAVAAQQRTAELTEWLGCAKIALQVWPFFLQASFLSFQLGDAGGVLGFASNSMIAMVLSTVQANC